MKLNLFGLLLMTCLFIVSCGKDEDSDTPGIILECGNFTCTNGGSCVDGVCECPEGYEGNSCETRLDPVSIKLNSITVKDFPLTDAFGSAWDDGGKVDLTFAIYQDSTELYLHPQIIIDADPNNDHNIIITSFTFSSPNADYIIQLLDDDETDPAQEIARYTFKPNLPTGTNGVLELRGGSSQIDLELKYQY